MFQLLKQIAVTGIKTEAAPGPDEALRVAAALREQILKRFHGALAIRHVDAGSCNGCELEVNALNNPYLQPRGPGHTVRREPAACGHAARHGTRVTSHGGGAQAHLRRRPSPSSSSHWAIAAAPAAFTAKVTQLRTRVERDPGRRCSAGLSSDAARDHAGHRDRDHPVRLAIRRCRTIAKMRSWRMRTRSVRVSLCFPLVDRDIPRLAPDAIEPRVHGWIRCEVETAFSATCV